MDYEQKYKEALADMKVIYPNLKGDAKLAVEHAFPELAESEDERIRKEIIGYLNSRVSTAEETELMYFKRWIAYLEKQKVFSNGEGCYYYHADSSYTFIGSMGFGPIEDIKINGERPKTENKSLDLPNSVKINGIGAMAESEEKQKEQKPEGVYVDCSEHPEWYGMPPKEQKYAWSEEYIRKDALIEKLEKVAASYKKRSDEGELVWQNMCGIKEAIEILNKM